MSAEQDERKRVRKKRRVREGGTGRAETQVTSLNPWTVRLLTLAVAVVSISIVCGLLFWLSSCTLHF